MNHTLKVTIAEDSLSYPIIIGDIKVTALADVLRKKQLNCAIVSDETIGNLYAEDLCKGLKDLGINAHLFTFPPGESHKTRKTKAELEELFFKKKLGKDTCLIAMGGGITCDLGGFLASTYCRGIPLILIPTSLLAMVDACIGGKTAVNVPWGKNLVGSMYHPDSVWINPSYLKTLPSNELSNGFSEIIKHALIADPQFLCQLEEQVDVLLAQHSPFFEKALIQSLTIKKTIVEQDEKERGIRRLLNFGHTIGHALENASSHHFLHGEAVAIGILVESKISHLLNLLSEEELYRIKKVLQAYRLPLTLPKNLSWEATFEALSLDKKALKKEARFSLLHQIGSPLEFEGNYCTSVPKKIIEEALKWTANDLCRH